MTDSGERERGQAEQLASLRGAIKQHRNRHPDPREIMPTWTEQPMWMSTTTDTVPANSYMASDVAALNE